MSGLSSSTRAAEAKQQTQIAAIKVENDHFRFSIDKSAISNRKSRAACLLCMQYPMALFLALL
jgi:hypothetical protein